MRAAPWWGYTTVSPTLKDIWQVPLPLKAILPRTGSPIKCPCWRIRRSMREFRAYQCSKGTLASRARHARRLAASTTVIVCRRCDRYPVYPTMLPRSGNRGPRVGRRSPAGPYWRERVRSLRPQQEEVPVSFASGPGRDDGSLPPVNIVIPDDARELDRDVLAYRRELRAMRRRQRLKRLIRPLRSSEFGGHAAIIPLIAACLAISLVGGALLSVITMSPALAPTQGGPQTSAQPAASPNRLTKLPTGDVRLSGRTVPVRSLVTATIALVPANCGCGTELDRLAGQAVDAHVGLYFAGAGEVISQLPALATRYGHGA